MTRSGIAYILDKHVTAARLADSAALPDRISPHTLRHSAMHLLQAGVNLVYIRDILGHADLRTTEIYARIDGEMKRQALKSALTNVTPTRSHAPRAPEQRHAHLANKPRTLTTKRAWALCHKTLQQPASTSQRQRRPLHNIPLRITGVMRSCA